MHVRSKPAHVAPAGFFIMFPVSFIITFFLALKHQHVKAIIPYISDTGDKPPESCAFAMLVSLCSVVLILSIYIRHLQISFHFEHYIKSNQSQKRWNNIATGFGVVSTFGLLLVANFQEDNDYLVHYTGASVCIWSGSIYFILQTFISHLMRSYLSSMYIHYIRVLLSTFTFLFNIIGLVTTVAAIQHPPQRLPQQDTVTRWSPDDTFWVAHVLSVTSEWTLALIQSVMVLTFVPELRCLKVVFPKLKARGEIERTGMASCSMDFCISRFLHYSRISIILRKNIGTVVFGYSMFQIIMCPLAAYALMSMPNGHIGKSDRVQLTWRTANITGLKADADHRSKIYLLMTDILIW